VALVEPGLMAERQFTDRAAIRDIDPKRIAPFLS
jgi:hypothetical protein